MSTNLATAPTPDEVRALRNALGLTQGQLAGRLGLSREAITAWEAGRSGPTGPGLILLRQLQTEADMKKTPTPRVISGNLAESSERPVDA